MMEENKLKFRSKVWKMVDIRDGNIVQEKTDAIVNSTVHLLNTCKYYISTLYTIIIIYKQNIEHINYDFTSIYI
jgi:hypothetical protein